MPELPTRIDGEVIEAQHMNDAQDRSVQRYTNAAQRDTLNPVVQIGQMAYIDDPGLLQYWDGSAWRTAYTVDGDIQIDGTVIATAIRNTTNTGAIREDGSISTIAINSVGDINIYTVGGDTASIRIREGGLAGTGFAVSDLDGVIAIYDYVFNQYVLWKDQGGPNTLRSRGGFYVTEYDSTPPDGGDIYGFQLRNVIVTDTTIPSASTGKDGDLAIQYTFAGEAQNEPAKLWVKVSGKWRGMS